MVAGPSADPRRLPTHRSGPRRVENAGTRTPDSLQIDLTTSVQARDQGILLGTGWGLRADLFPGLEQPQYSNELGALRNVLHPVPDRHLYG